MTDQTITEGSPEYNEAMAAKFQNREVADVDPVEKLPVEGKPEGGHDKFYNAETGQYDWQNHAKELDYKLNGKPAEPAKAEDATPTGETETNDEAVADIVSTAGLDPSELQKQIEADGNLSDEAYAALAKVGLGRDLVETYVNNMVFRQEASANAALEYAGGESEWNALSNWAKENVPEGEVNRYNEMLNTSEWKVAIDALKMRQQQSTGEPSLLNGTGITTSTSSGYRSKAEMKADMSNPAYQTDPAFRQQVAMKMQRAQWDLE